VSELYGRYFYLYPYALRAVADYPCSSTRSIRISTPYAFSCTEGILVLTSNSGNSARSQLIKTRRRTWIDESLLPEARRECLEILREAARRAVGEDAYIPGWISDACDRVHSKASDISTERLTPERTPTQEKMDEEIHATVEALRSRGAFKSLSNAEVLSFLSYIFESIGSRYAAQEAREVEEMAARRRPIPKSNPTLITEKELLDLTFDVIASYGIVDSIIELDFVRGAAIEEWEAGERARGGPCNRQMVRLLWPGTHSSRARVLRGGNLCRHEAA
jgi:hypothetical protein